ncbi:HemK2/MTQ2 family protein methyltransferase [Candidatus Methanoplasma termitum]|nr:HemK2/MTQ2 family protein methyltransferase [Candidatus Methanoplasma termitum]
MEYRPDLIVEKDDEVYPPSDDSILLIGSFDVKEGERILEIGCGSGIVSMHCVLYGGVVTCGDINEKAVALTKKNMKLNSLYASVVETDVYSGVNSRFNTIIFNLPYLPVNEKGKLAKAWSGGEDGLGPLPKLLYGAPSHLLPGGRIIVVVSSLMDQEALRSILEGFEVRTLAELPLFFEELSVLEIIP